MRRRTRLRLLLVCASSVLALGAAEIAVRLAGARADPWQGPYDLRLLSRRGLRVSSQDGPLHLELAPFTVYRNRPNQRTRHFSTTAAGLRGHGPSRTHRGPRVVVLGGSTAFGVGAGSDADTFQALIEAADSRYEVLNAAVVGYQSGQELAALVTDRIDLEPDLVVAFDGWNDLRDPLAWPWRVEERDDLGFNTNFEEVELALLRNHRASNRVSVAAARLLEAASKRSALLRFVRWRLASAPAVLAPRPARGLGADRERLFRAVVASYTGNLQKMSAFCEGRGVRFLVVLQPEIGLKRQRTEAESRFMDWASSPWLDHRTEFPRLYARFLRRVKATLARRGIEFLDVNEDPRFLDSREQLFADVVHLSRAGNAVVAEILRERLDRLELEPAAGRPAQRTPPEPDAGPVAGDEP